MLMHLCSALLLMLFFISCGNQGAGVSTDSQASRDTKQGDALSRTKTLTSEQRTSVTVTVPITPLIGEAWRELLFAEKNLPKETACEEMWAKPLSAIGTANDDPTKSLLCAFMMGYYYAFTPTMGWPVEPKSEKGGSYMLRTISYVLHVNNLASDIAAQVAGHAYQNPQEAKAAIKQLLLEQRSYLMQAYPASFELHLIGRSIIDMSSVKDVTFAKGPYHVTLGPNGAVIKYSGVDWFGNGNLSGTRYELQLASMTGVAMTKGKTVTESGEQKIGASNKAQAGVGK